MNRLLTPAEAGADVNACLEKHGIPQMLAEASEEQREVMVTLLANMFGAGFPVGWPEDSKR